MPIDSSLIAGAGVARVEPFLDKIGDRLYDRPLLLKPHPLAPKSTDLLALYRHFPRARFVDDNIYALLARSGVADVVTLSSSVAAEAPFFGKQVTALIMPDMLGPPPDSVSRFHRVGAGVTTTAFWGSVLHDMPGFMFVEAPPRPVRSRFSVGWGFVADMAAVAPRDVAEGETVSFAKGGRGPPLCLVGWSEPEPWGLRSDGTEALLQFVPPAGWNAFVAELTLTPHVPDPDRPLAVSVIARGDGTEEAMSFRFETQEPTVDEIPLTGGAMPGPIELLFRIADPVSPRQGNGGDDDRKLGLGLHKLTVRRLASAPTECRS